MFQTTTLGPVSISCHRFHDHYRYELRIKGVFQGQYNSQNPDLSLRSILESFYVQLKYYHYLSCYGSNFHLTATAHILAEHYFALFSTQIFNFAHYLRLFGLSAHLSKVLSNEGNVIITVVVKEDSAKGYRLCFQAHFPFESVTIKKEYPLTPDAHYSQNQLIENSDKNECRDFTDLVKRHLSLF